VRHGHCLALTAMAAASPRPGSVSARIRSPHHGSTPPAPTAQLAGPGGKGGLPVGALPGLCGAGAVDKWRSRGGRERGWGDWEREEGWVGV
jgi:hypothetical protein